MVDPQIIKWKIEAVKEIRAALKSCRAGKFETLEKMQGLLKLLPGPTKDREAGEGQKSKTSGVGPGELERDLKDLKQRIGEGISVSWTRFHSQIDFENELLKKMRTTIFQLKEKISDVEIEKWPPADLIRFYELNHQIMTESQNFLLKYHGLSRERMEDPDFMQRMEKGLKGP